MSSNASWGRGAPPAHPHHVKGVRFGAGLGDRTQSNSLPLRWIFRMRPSRCLAVANPFLGRFPEKEKKVVNEEQGQPGLFRQPGFKPFNKLLSSCTASAHNGACIRTLFRGLLPVTSQHPPPRALKWCLKPVASGSHLTG